MKHITRLIILSACIILAASAQAARVDTISIATNYLPGGIGRATVVTPDGKPGQKFPTVYLLNGYDGDHKSWIDITQPQLPALADKYGMVMVMPDGMDSWYWDAPARPGMKMETYITSQLVPYIDANYPTLPQSGKRAITGLSMGGQGAMWLAMRHPDIFGSAGSTSGGLDIRPFPKNWKMAQWLGAKDTNPQVWEDHAIVNLVPSLQPGTLNIIFDCGTDDFFYKVNQNLHEELLKAKIPHDFISRPGNHSHTYWRNAILYQLLFFNEAFNQ